MAKECTMSFQQRSLFQQGYQRYTTSELKQLEWGLRFTPAVCSLIAAYGLVTQQPYVLFGVAVLGIWAFFFPAGHPMDLIYNHLVRPLFGAVKLPENPLQRRLACLSAGIMNVAAGALFLLGLPVAAIVTGVILLVLQAIVITTHFCTLSWMYEGVMRLLGRWHEPVDTEQAKALIRQGAVVVDVRSQNEFAEGAVKCAVNLPLEDLDTNLDKFRNGKYLLYCRSGMRSQIAATRLKEKGLDNIFDLGPIERAEEIATAAA
jgi:rhodanese-related sulfurtransferase